MEKVYISGKVTGLPWEEVEDKFRAAADLVRCHGSLAVVPIHYCRKDWPWWQCMKQCLALMLECDRLEAEPGGEDRSPCGCGLRDSGAKTEAV